MTHDFHSPQLETLWLLSGQVEEDAPIRDIPIRSLRSRSDARPGLALSIPSPTVSKVHAEFLERAANCAAGPGKHEWHVRQRRTDLGREAV